MKEGLSERVVSGVLGFVVSLEPPSEEETEGEPGIEICGTGGAGSGGWSCSVGGFVVEWLATDEIVERRLLFLSFLLFLFAVDSGRGEPATEPGAVLR